MIGNKVIKALEHWIKNFDGKAVDLMTLCGAFNLINCQQKTIDRLKSENKNCGRTILNQRQQLKACNEKIKEQQAEMIEANLNNKWLDRYNEKCIEIVKLNHAVQAAKSVAVKEFAERLKAMKFAEDTISADEVVYVEDIDDLLKEMEYE